MHILIADDQPKVRSMLRTLLADAGTEFAEATDGRDAVEKFRQGPWDLVLMDVRMPVMDGIDATRIILSEDPRAFVIIVTDYDDDDCCREALQLGSKALFGKGDLMALRAYVRALQGEAPTHGTNAMKG